MKKFLSGIKPYLRWIILGVTLFFLAKTLKENWEQVLEIRISDSGWVSLRTAFIITTIAHLWSGWVWFWIIKEFNQSLNPRWAIRVYLMTNIAKYLPGNIWHFYGRITATKQAGLKIEIATLSVLIEPILMAAAALTIALVTAIKESYLLSLFGLIIILTGIHPLILNPVIKYVSKLKLKVTKSDLEVTPELKIERYLIKPFLGEICFVLIRGSGFLFTILAFNPVELNQVLLIFSAFSAAWLLGLVVPGAPGGVGVFEATVLTLLEHEFSPGILLSVVAFYRLISVLTETFVAGLAWLDKRLFN